jgi:hypothetical protein
MHYPGHLRDAFHDAMDAYLTGAEVDDELFYDPAQQQRWAAYLCRILAASPRVNFRERDV